MYPYLYSWLLTLEQALPISHRISHTAIALMKVNSNPKVRQKNHTINDVIPIEIIIAIAAIAAIVANDKADLYFISLSILCLFVKET